MTVAYAPPLTGGGLWGAEKEVREVVESGPAYIRTRLSTRWHRIRSCYNVLREGDAEIQTRWSFWCGPGTGTYRQPITTDDPPAAEPLCGTCEGRFAGWVRDHNWLFTPRLLVPPKLCPGSGSMRFIQELEWNRGICAVCCKPVKLRAFGSWYNSSFGAQRHTPGLDLVPGCAFHGWRELTVNADGAVVCRCEVVRA